MATGTQSAAERYDRPMDVNHREILTKCRLALVTDMDPEQVLRYMVDPHLFSPDEKDKINANNLTRAKQCETLLDILPRKGVKAYEIFKETIRNVHRHLFSTIEETETKVLASELGKVLRQSPDYVTKHIQDEASKITIFKESVTGEAFSYFSEERGVKINVSPKTMPEPKIIVCSSWRRNAVSLPLEDDETLVSSLIELQCDDPVGVNFTGITLALSHSAVESKQNELVMKERVDREKNTWKDLETSSEPLEENGESRGELRFVQARITSFSLYAVICRLKSYTFSYDASVESPVFTCKVSEYPGMSLTIPRRFMSEDMKVKIKVQDVPNADFEETLVLVGPILHIDSPMGGELEEPASITMPIALEQDQEKVQNVEISQVRLCSRSKRDDSKEWVDITKELKPPAKLEDRVLTFQVKSTDSSFGVVTTKSPEEPDIPRILNQTSSVQQYAGFQACLCDIGRPSEQQLIVCCYPSQSKNTLKVSSEYKVVGSGQQRSQEPLKKEEKVFFSLSDALIRTEESGEELMFLRFLGDDSFSQNFPVRVAKPGSFPKILFFTQDQEICSLFIFPVFPTQKNSPNTSQDIPDAVHLVELLNKRTEPFTSHHLLEIKEDVGTCWEDLGQALGINRSILEKLKDDYRTNRQRANKVLQIWMEMNRTDATVGCLACMVMQIGHKRIAEKLLDIKWEPEGEQSEKPCEREGKQSESMSEVEGEQSQQSSELEAPDEILSLLTEGIQICPRGHKLEEVNDESKRRPSSEVELLRNENNSLIKENELKTINENLSSKVRTQERERLRKEVANANANANANADSLQKIEELKTKIKALETENNSLQSKIRGKESETERLQMHRPQVEDNIVKANADFLQRTADLEKKTKALELRKKMESKDSEKCKMLEEEVNKYKNAVCRAFLPSGKEFTSPIGVLSTLSRDRSAKLVATRSSEGPGEASDIFNHSKGKESGTAEIIGSWWKVDLGEHHRLAITHYALRHGKRDGESILRKWQLEGSIDGLIWMNLKSAQDPKDPPQFCDPSPYYTGRWSIVGEVRAFRYFRILQTGPNSAGKYGIYLSGLELYGTLVKL